MAVTFKTYKNDIFVECKRLNEGGGGVRRKGKLLQNQTHESWYKYTIYVLHWPYFNQLIFIT